MHTNEDKIFREIITTCCEFSGEPVKRIKRIFRGSNPLNKLKRGIESWKGALKDTKITNKDYGEIIHKYDSPDTFFFVDLPYEMTIKSFGYAEDTDFDFVRLETLIRLIKGKFLMTINDSPNIRQLFKGFNMKSWKVKSYWYNTKDRKESLISKCPQKKYP